MPLRQRYTGPTTGIPVKTSEVNVVALYGLQNVHNITIEENTMLRSAVNGFGFNYWECLSERTQLVWMRLLAVRRSAAQQESWSTMVD